MNDSSMDKNRRRFLVSATTLLGAIAAVFASIPFISAWFPSARAKAAGAPVEVDISHLEPGDIMTVAWRGKPVWIVHRTPQMLSELKKIGNELRDPNSKVDQQPPYADNIYRSIRPEILVLIGICTHLGCSPLYRPKVNSVKAGWPGGFYCPCHGSLFDLAGRVFKGVPAPINLAVPPYHFVNKELIVVGEGLHRG